MFFAASSGSSFNAKGPSSSSKPQAQPWQSGRPAATQNKPWMAGSGSGSTPKTSTIPQPASAQPTKPNYNFNFPSVIGCREERGIRGPGFGKSHFCLTHTQIFMLQLCPFAVTHFQIFLRILFVSSLQKCIFIPIRLLWQSVSPLCCFATQAPNQR